jgi:hypothetical protein
LVYSAEEINELIVFLRRRIRADNMCLGLLEAIFTRIVARGLKLLSTIGGSLAHRSEVIFASQLDESLEVAGATRWGKGEAEDSRYRWAKQSIGAINLEVEKSKRYSDWSN